MTDTFGARLRRAREERRISLADIAARTKIKASLFEELERDDPSHWPVGIFRRSFMRAYAQSVGLDPDETVREFLRHFPDPHEPPATPGGVPPARAVAAQALPPAAPVAPTATGSSGAATQPPGGSALRLTLVETAVPFTGGRMLAEIRRRWSAAAWDLGFLLVIAVTVFVIMDAFWMPFSVTALCYYVGGVLFLGNSPGVCLFAPKPAPFQEAPGRRAQRARLRPSEPAPVRHAEAAFRARRWQNEVRM